jgi:hypothetical protein
MPGQCTYVDAVTDPLEELPPGYALALRLRAAGLDDHLLARCLDIEPEAIPAFLRIAAAKLAHVRDSDPKNA